MSVRVASDFTRPRADAPPSRGFVLLAAAGALATLVLLVRLAVFATYADPPAAWSVAPWSPFMTRHACSTAYWSAATGITQTPDVWDIRLYSLGQDPASGRLIPRTVGAFNIDPYEYPPTFLLAPRALATVTPDYVAFRHVWLVLNAALVIVGMAVLARQLDVATGRRTLWLLPLALVPLSTMYALQMGNAQLLYIVIAMLGLAAFARQHHALGGLLLAFTVVGKMFPAILLIYLALRRDWRAVGWTVAWGAVFVLATLADVGWAPFPFFLDHLPRLLSGEAFPMLRATITAANNMSIPGLVLKPAAFGGPVIPFVAIKVAGWVYSAVVLWVVVRLALRPVAPRYEPLAWLTILGVTALRSPFLPTYGAFPGAWLGAILLAVCWAEPRRWWAVLGCWLILVPTTAGPTPMPVWVVAAFTTVQAAAVVGLMAIAIRVGREGATATAGAA
jgi:alpha-1,2-mannosyltransferase